MAGSDFVFNHAKGKVGYYCSLPAADDAIIAVLLEAAGLEADSTLEDYETLDDLLANNTESAMGRVEIDNVTWTVNTSANRGEGDGDDAEWVSPTGSAVGKLLLCYQPDSLSTDADIIPMLAWSLDFTPGSGGLQIAFSSAGIVHAV